MWPLRSPHLEYCRLKHWWNQTPTISDQAGAGRVVECSRPAFHCRRHRKSYCPVRPPDDRQLPRTAKQKVPRQLSNPEMNVRRNQRSKRLAIMTAKMAKRLLGRLETL